VPLVKVRRFRLGEFSSGLLSSVVAVEFGWREFRSVMICSVSAVKSGSGQSGFGEFSLVTAVELS